MKPKLTDDSKRKNACPGAELIKSILRKFPDAGSLTVAKMAYKENPHLFNNIESARATVRYYRGAQGKARRGFCSSAEFFRDPKAPGDPFGSLPEGLTHFDDWKAVQIDGPLKALILSDAHVPYHNKSAIISALKYGRDNGADTVFFNGDTSDCFSLSKWEKDPLKRDFESERQTVISFLKTVRELFRKARLIMKEGNHEERFMRYIMCKAPEIFGVPEFRLEKLLGLDKIGAEWIGERRPVRLGDLNIIHGHEYPFAISNPVNPARGLFLRAKRFAMCGHFHQSSYHSEKDLEEQVTGTWSTGCLCDLHPDYAPLNKWNHGFAFVEVYGDGKFEVKNLFIGAGGKVY